MVSRMWFCISCRSVNWTWTVKEIWHSGLPLLERTTRFAAVASDGGACCNWSASPSLTTHSFPEASVTSRLPPATKTCGWPSLNKRAIPLEAGSGAALARSVRFLVLKRQLSLHLVGDHLLHLGSQHWLSAARLVRSRLGFPSLLMGRISCLQILRDDIVRQPEGG